MSPEGWPDVERIYYFALACDSAGLPAYLKQACGDDEVLRREVESLLAANQRAGEFLTPQAMEGQIRLITAEYAGIGVGKSLGSYRISSQIGAGGMGDVYRATDTKLDREVAIKVLSPAFAADPARVQRFEREAQVLAALNHPNIATIYGIEQGAIVMELVEGANLRGPVAVNIAIQYARQITAALDAAHERGVVHRDLKPGNIKITEKGSVKVLDFGLAKAFARETGGKNPAASPAEVQTTRTGVILGTPGYMSPEQARGELIDQRTDIWAFGVVFYEMLAGRGAFERETVADTIAAVLGAEIDWSLLPAGTPPKVRRLFRRCLERDVKRRLRDIGDAWIEFDAPEEAEASGLPRRRVAAARLSAALAIGMGAGWLIWHAAPRPPEPVARWFETIAADQLELSDDGSRLLYGDDSIARSYLRLLDRFDSQPIAGFSRGFATFSPDGRWLAVANQTGLQKLPAMGGTPVTLSGEAGTSQPSWGDDGTIVFSTRRGLMRISNQGGNLQILTTVDPGKGETAHVFPRLLPGSRAVLFTVRTGIRNEDTRVAVLDLKKGSSRTIRENAFDARYVPTGQLLYMRGGSLIAAPFDLKRLEVTGGEAPVVDGLPQDSYESRYSVSSTGVLAYLSGDVTTEGSVSLEWRDRKGRVVSSLPSRLWGVPSLSPDASRVVAGIYTGGVRRSGGDLWVYEVARGALTRLTFDGASVQGIWTPDGRRIAIGSDFNGRTGIYTIPSDFSGHPELLVAGDGGERPQSWSPDGKTLLYSAGKWPRLSLWLISVPGGQPRVLLQGPANIVAGRISPDGRWLAYQSNESGRREIYVQAFPNLGSKIQISIGEGAAPRLRNDGRELFYLDPTVTPKGPSG